MAMESSVGLVTDEQIVQPSKAVSRRKLMKLGAAAGISLAALKLFNPKTAFAAEPTGGPTDGDTQFPPPSREIASTKRC